MNNNVPFGSLVEMVKMALDALPELVEEIHVNDAKNLLERVINEGGHGPDDAVTEAALALLANTTSYDDISKMDRYPLAFICFQHGIINARHEWDISYIPVDKENVKNLDMTLDELTDHIVNTHSQIGKLRDEPSLVLVAINDVPNELCKKSGVEQYSLRTNVFS